MLGYVLQKYSGALSFHDRPREAATAYRRALAIYQNLLAKPKSGAVEMNDLANALVKCPFPRLRDPAQALRVAERANLLTNGRNPVILDTLAWAHYRSGQPVKAAAVSRTALSLPPKQGSETGLRKEISDGLAEFQRAVPR